MKRFPVEGKGRCSAVESDGLVYAVATDPVCAQGIFEQTHNTLNELERLLTVAGSGKTELIQATVYLSDITNKTKMDTVWVKWIGADCHWPQRACVGVDLDQGYLIEVVVVARAH